MVDINGVRTSGGIVALTDAEMALVDAMVDAAPAPSPEAVDAVTLAVAKARQSTERDERVA